MSFITAPAHPHATGVVVYPALLLLLFCTYHCLFYCFAFSFACFFFLFVLGFVLVLVLIPVDVLVVPIYLLF